jgi:hypothetical protein
MTPAVGYRLWRVDPEDSWTRNQLQSLVSETLWPPREKLRAECRRRQAWFTSRHHAPEAHAPAASPLPDCTCGIYAWHEVTTMMRTQRDEPLAFGGAVLCWGRIVIHPEGLRAQFARPLALSLPLSPAARSRTARVLREVTESYGIPLLEPDHLVAYAQEFGVSYKPEIRRTWFEAVRRLLAA